MKNLERPVKITCCCDGHVSIMRTAKDRRLKSALPCYSMFTVGDAIALISRVCTLKACEHGGKTGTLIEPWAPNWVRGGGNLELLEDLNEIFYQAEESQRPNVVTIENVTRLEVATLVELLERELVNNPPPGLQRYLKERLDYLKTQLQVVDEKIRQDLLNTLGER